LVHLIVAQEHVRGTWGRSPIVCVGLGSLPASGRVCRQLYAWTTTLGSTAPSDDRCRRLGGTAVLGCGFNRSMQQFGGIVQLVFRSL